MEGAAIIEPIKIGGFWAKVTDESQALAYQQLCGAWVGARNHIQINTAFDEQTQAETLVHEVVHAILAVYLEGVPVEEAFLAPFAQGLFQVIGDNPHLIERVWAMAEGGRDVNGVKDTASVGEKD